MRLLSILVLTVYGLSVLSSDNANYMLGGKNISVPWTCMSVFLKSHLLVTVLLNKIMARAHEFE